MIDYDEAMKREAPSVRAGQEGKRSHGERSQQPARLARPGRDDGPQHIGWREYVDFPDWHIRGVMAKADTGARTGALDVSEVEELPGGRVRFAIRLRRKSGPEQFSRHIEASISRRSRVRSAFGHARDRLFIETTVRLGHVEKKVELGLVCRKKMLCRVLLGRRALENDFLVDSGRRYLFGRRKPLRDGESHDGAGVSHVSPGRPPRKSSARKKAQS